MTYVLRVGVRYTKSSTGMMDLIPGSGKVLGSYKRYQDAKGAATKHRNKFPKCREMRITDC